MRVAAVLALARAEARTIGRLARYWLFALLSMVLVVVFYLYYGALHGFFSWWSGTAGSMNPKFLLAQLGLWQLVLFAVGIVFLAFDVRARDERERMAEVLDVRPYTNLELLGGRFLGTLLMAWIPVLVVAVMLQLLGGMANLFGWPIGDTMEWHSLVTFILLMAIPAFAFTIALIYLVSMLVRHRLVAALVGLALIALATWATFALPIYLQPAFDVTGGFSIVVSELAPRIGSLPFLLQRAGLLMAALGLVGFAALRHPRLDGGSRPLRAAAAGGLLLGALLMLGAVARGSIGAEQRFEHWKSVHAERQDEPVVDLGAVAGEVVVDPGRRLALTLDLRFSAPDARALDRLLFTFNPGLEVRVAESGGEPLVFTHQDGLLEVELPKRLAPGAEGTLRLVAEGRPRLDFAYLDSVRRLEEGSAMDGQLALLGVEAAVFERRYVALMPGVRWLPMPGADVGRDDPRRHPRDLFEVDLTVEVPEGWLAVAPGRRQQLERAEPGRDRFRFAPPAPLSEVALLASRFERRAAEVEGVELEILLHPGHTGNLEVFAEAAGEIRDFIGERLREAAELGLPYPYGSLSMVEVPNVLRGYGGGWRMDTVMAPPGLLLVRETGFPTSRFDFPFRNRDRFADEEGGIAGAKRRALERFFENDFNGDNVFLGAARNFLLYQVAARGREALALDFLSHDLGNRLLIGKRGYFSAHLWNRDLGWVVGGMFQNMFEEGGGGSVAEAVIRTATDRPEVWEHALAVSLADMDPWQDPGRSVNVLVLKGGAISSSLLDGLGRERTGELLAALRQHHLGETFDAADLEAVAEEVGVDLDALLGQWIEETALPGFVASSAELYRLADDDGLPRYQLRLSLRNDEAVPGLVRLRYTTEEPGRRVEWEQSDPVHVGAGEAVEIGLITSKPPRRLEVAPYLSLNRQPFPVELPSVDEETIVDAAPLAGAQASDWRPHWRGEVVVDDLDTGFGIEGEQGGSGFRLAGLGAPATLDQGIPEFRFGQPPETWSRRGLPAAWGRYRRTVVFVRSGSGEARAVFSAELPHAGRWRLELHLPAAVQGGQSFSPTGRAGAYHLEVDGGDGPQPLVFDAAGGEAGWNELGDFELGAGRVRVELTRESDGRTVIADAICWRPLDVTAAVAESEPRAGAGDG